MGSVLEFQNISKYFPGVKALDGISFKAYGGEVLAFLGGKRSRKVHFAEGSEWRLPAKRR